MNGIEAVLLVLGFFSISVSFFVGKKETPEAEEDMEADGVSKDVWTEKEEELVRERIHSIMEEEKEDILAETTDILNRKSNEKIMEFDEFSNQLMAKINHNHDEVVFMYNTLTAKEEELKEAVAKLSVPAAAPKAEKPSLQEPPVQTPAQLKKTAPQRASQPQEAEPQPQPEPAQERTGKGPVTGLEQLAKKSSGRAKKAASDKIPVASGETETPSSVKHPENVNDQIVKMYKQGKSVVEISKELNVGQGEVKLTIALYGGKR